MRQTREVIAEVRNLSYRYRGLEGDPALCEIELDVYRGEFLVIAGRTGSGKSTLCFALNGLVPHSFGGQMDGRVRVCGMDTREARIPALARKIGMVLQSAESQIVGLTVLEDVEFGLENLALSRHEILERAHMALSIVRLDGFADRSPWTLSGGQKQRLAIAAALAFRPELLVLDNPTAELDPVGKEEVLETIARLNREHGITVVMANQELHEVIPYASRLLLLDAGRIARLGTPTEVLDDAETVRSIGIRLPDPTEIAFQLRRRGWWTGSLPTTVGDARERIIAAAPSLRLEPPPTWRTAEPPARVPLIRLENVRFAYRGGPEVLRGVSTTIGDGEFVALMGPNGAGKTTLAKHLNGLLRPTSGRVLVDGADTREYTVAQLAAQIGYVFQNPDHQIFAPSVAEELAFGPRNLGWSQPRIDAAVDQMLDDLGLTAQRDAAPFFLGLAQRKLLAIGSVLVMGPRVLVLDEPATGADYNVTLVIMQYIRRLHERGLTVVIITHDVSLAATYAERLIVINDGQITLEGSPRALFREPERLRSAYITVPQVTELARGLARLGIPPDLIRVDELVDALGAA